ncbi:MAG: hypothetical protein Q8L22_00770 [Reyranella sp.]|nr:hypothetical protein [Reyranella sp.]
MRNIPNGLPSGLKGRGILAACVTGAAILGLAGVAEAGEGHGKKYRGYYGPGYVMVPPGHVRYYAPAPVVYAVPAPVMVYPAPVAYVPAYPAYGYPGGSLSIGLNLPLR